MSSNVVWFADIGLADLETVGGKNSSLGEMVRELSSAGVRVPDGFATTAEAYRRFIGETGLAEMISGELRDLDTDDVQRLAEVGQKIRTAVVAQTFPEDLEADIRAAYTQLVGDDAGGVLRGPVQRHGRGPARRLVRRAAGDLPQRPRDRRHPDRHPRGVRVALQRPGHRLPGAPRASSTRRSPCRRACSGWCVPTSAPPACMFTMDTESGFTDAVFITSSYGLGEAVVQGAVNPDEFYVYKPALRAGRPAILKRGIGGKATKMIYTDDREVGKTTAFVDVDEADRRRLSLTDDEVSELARHALAIEEHYGRPMDIEWGKDGRDGRLYILQARPETVQSRAVPAPGSASASTETGPGPGRGPRHRPEDRRRRGPRALHRRRDARIRARRGARRRHDRPGLGADHEAGLGDRHQPGRPDLPRGDHRPRAGHPGRRRHRRGHPGAD